MRKVLALCAGLVAALTLPAGPASALPAAGLTPAGEIVLYDTATPGTIAERHPITGLQPNERVMGLDTRPATGQLFALGIVRAATDTARLYVIDPGTGIAQQVGADPFKTDYTQAEYGMDFNPAVDRLRIVNRADENGRVHPDTGAFIGPDTPLNPASDLDAVAYDQNVAGTPQTTLWGYDSATDKVVRIGGVNGGPPDGGANGGKVVQPFGASGVSTTGRAEMDIGPGGAAFLTAQTVGPAYGLYSVGFSTGTLTLVGAFPEAVEDLALLAPSSFALDGSSLNVPEDVANAVVTVNRTGNSTGTQTVAYATADGSATAGDYTPSSGTLTFGPGEASKTFSVPVANDTADEPAESVMLSLSAPSTGAALGSPATGTLTILDDDPAADTLKPTLLLALPGSGRLGKLLRGVKGKVSASEACTIGLVLKLGKRTLGKASVAATGPGVKSFNVKLSRAGKKALRKQLKRKRTARLALTATGTDAARNAGTARARITATR